jgi:hypothetical protein
MNISEKLTQQHLQSILLDCYKKGEESENMKVIDFIENMKNDILEAIRTHKN